MLTNRVSFLGSYVFNWALSRVRCYVEVCGSEAELGMAGAVLEDLGWRGCTSVRYDNVDGRISFVRDVRGTISTQTEVELVNKLNQRLTDAYCTARINAVALAPIQYPSPVVHSAVLPREGLVIGGMQADRFSEVSYLDNGGVGANSNPTQGDDDDSPAEDVPFDPSRWTVRLGHALYGALDRMLVSHLLPRLERWLLSGSTPGDSPILRRSLLLWGFVVSLVAIVLGVLTPRFNPADALHSRLIPGLFIGILIFVVVNLAALQIITRVIVEPRYSIGIIPPHWSPYSSSQWSDTTNPDVVEILGSRRSQALGRLNRTVMTALRFVLIGFSGVFIYLLFQLVRSTPSLVGIPAVMLIVLVWFVISDILRSRRRVVVRSAVMRGIQVLMVLGVAGLLLRLPTLAFYNELGATDLALEVSWTEAAFHAVPLVAIILGSAVFCVSTWVLAPRLDRWSRDLFSLVMTANVVSAVLTGIIVAMQPAAEIRSGNVASESPAVKATCTLRDGAWVPTWAIGRTENPVLANRIVGADANIGPLQVPADPGTFRVVHVSDRC